jgi:hypothetical protein
VGTTEELQRVTTVDLPRWVSELKAMLRKKREPLPESVGLAWLRSNPVGPMFQGSPVEGMLLEESTVPCLVKE